MIEDTLLDVAPLAPFEPKKRRASGIERMNPIGKAVAVRGPIAIGNWHLATHIRYVDDVPEAYVVYCGERVAFDCTATRDPSGLGFLGVGFVCARCTQVMSLKPATERPRPRRRDLPEKGRRRR
jgi:hypothetical protein